MSIQFWVFRHVIFFQKFFFSEPIQQIIKTQMSQYQWLLFYLTTNLWSNSLYFAFDTLSGYSPWAQNKVVMEPRLIKFKNPLLYGDETEFYGKNSGPYRRDKSIRVGTRGHILRFTVVVGLALVIWYQTDM